MSLFISVEVLAGTEISASAKEAAALANRIGVWVQFKFNGVSCHVAPGCDPDDLVVEWDLALKSTHRHKMAFARPGGNYRHTPDSAGAQWK